MVIDNRSCFVVWFVASFCWAICGVGTATNQDDQSVISNAPDLEKHVGKEVRVKGALVGYDSKLGGWLIVKNEANDEQFQIPMGTEGPMALRILRENFNVTSNPEVIVKAILHCKRASDDATATYYFSKAKVEMAKVETDGCVFTLEFRSIAKEQPFPVPKLFDSSASGNARAAKEQPTPPRVVPKEKS